VASPVVSLTLSTVAMLSKAKLSEGRFVHSVECWTKVEVCDATMLNRSYSCR